MRKIGAALPLKERLVEFLLVFRATPHATTERHPDELLLLGYIIDLQHVIFPNLAPTVKHLQQRQKTVL